MWEIEAKQSLLTGGKSITGPRVVVSTIRWRLGGVRCCPVARLLPYTLGNVPSSIARHDLQPGCDTRVQWLQKVLVQSLFPVDVKLNSDTVLQFLRHTRLCCCETCLVHLQSVIVQSGLSFIVQLLQQSTELRGTETRNVHKFFASILCGVIGRLFLKASRTRNMLRIELRSIWCTFLVLVPDS